MPKVRFVELPSGAVLDVENISSILRVELNKYAIMPKQAISPNVPFVDGDELEVFKKLIGVEKMAYTAPPKEGLIEVAKDDKQGVKV